MLTVNRTAVTGAHFGVKVSGAASWHDRQNQNQPKPKNHATVLSAPACERWCEGHRPDHKLRSVRIEQLWKGVWTQRHLTAESAAEDLGVELQLWCEAFTQCSHALCRDRGWCVNAHTS
eukprot:363391-Chlamydomonas_euryale.AAC.12